MPHPIPRGLQIDWRGWGSGVNYLIFTLDAALMVPNVYNH